MAAALVFLEGNGITMPESTQKLYDAMIAVAEKRMNKTELAALLRELAGK
jgi:death-on-curing protein